MTNAFRRIFYDRAGRPRAWLLSLLLDKNGRSRPIFRRIVHKKNGSVRPQYAYWVNKAQSGTGDPHGDGARGGLPPDYRAAEVALHSLLPLDRKIEAWRSRGRPARLLGNDYVQTIIRSALNTRASRRLIIAVGHDNYREVIGGVQLCCQKEELLAAEAGYCYLQIHPYEPVQWLARPANGSIVVTGILDGKNVGQLEMSALIEAVRQLHEHHGVLAEVVIHHLLGHAPEDITELVKAAGKERCLVWLHDFFTLCPSFTLQRNGISFCNAPSVDSNACFICAFGSERANHYRRMLAFFESVRIDVASPSKSTAELWLSRGQLPAASVSVVPHMSLELMKRQDLLQSSQERVVAVGYLGFPVQHKGWPVFRELMTRFGGSGRFRFVVLSSKRPKQGEHQWAEVNVKADDANAMAKAVAAEGIDIVLHWPTWPETFSFTTFEALAGSAYVVTNPVSGNVAALVRDSGHGVVLPNEADLFDFFSDGRAEALAKERREAHAETEISVSESSMSLSFLESE